MNFDLYIFCFMIALDEPALVSGKDLLLNERQAITEIDDNHDM